MEGVQPLEAFEHHVHVRPGSPAPGLGRHRQRAPPRLRRDETRQRQQDPDPPGLSPLAAVHDLAQERSGVIGLPRELARRRGDEREVLGQEARGALVSGLHGRGATRAALEDERRADRNRRLTSATSMTPRAGSCACRSGSPVRGS